jgi:hypothetical protein
MLALLAAQPAGAARSAPNSPAASDTPLLRNAQQTPASMLGRLTLHPKAAPVLGSTVNLRSNGAKTPAQGSVCTAAHSKRRATGCSTSSVTIPACMYSCWNAQHTTETCACCWPGHELLDNSCEPCPVGTYARNGWNVCVKCSVGYSTFSDKSNACNGKAAAVSYK